MSSCLGVASKALLMSIVMSSVLLCGALSLKPSSMSCVICVSNVLVERVLWSEAVLGGR